MNNLNRKEKIEQFREAFDYAYFKRSELNKEEVMKLFEEAGIDTFIERYLAYQDKNYPKISITGMNDFTNLSFKVYENLDNLPLEKCVKIPEASGSYKFIATGISNYTDLVEDKDELSFERNQIRFFSTEDTMHKEIANGVGFKSVKNVRGLGTINEREIFGGGWIDIDYEKKEIKVHSSSGSFGSCSNLLVEWLLEEFEKEGYTVDVDLDNQKHVGG